MPWLESKAVNERMKFIVEWSESEDENFSAHCRRFGISRRVGYKWLDRFEKDGPAGLEDRPPIAKRCKHRIPLEVVDTIIAGRKAHPTWGPRKLHDWLLAKDPNLAVPAPSTIGDIINRYGLIRPHKRRLRVPVRGTHPLDPCAAPNDVWCADFKGNFALGDGIRCHPLTMTDACSRYLLKCEGLLSEKEEYVRPHFELAFREFGLPKRLRTDNGPPFSARGGLSRLSVWLIQLGVIPERITPGHPEQNGRHERMHRTLKAETATPPKADMSAQQRAFDVFRAEFNNERPHEALGQKPPRRVHTLSLREYPRNLKSPEYGDDFIVRLIDSEGALSWKNDRAFVTTLLAGEPVGLRLFDDDCAEVFYGPLLLGCLRYRDGRIAVLRGYDREMAQSMGGKTREVAAANAPSETASVPDEPDSGPAETVDAVEVPDRAHDKSDCGGKKPESEKARPEGVNCTTE